MSKAYTPIDAGLKELGRSPAVGRAAVAAAQQLAAEANKSDPSGKYEAVPKTVIAGWNNEQRAGAAVRETELSWRGRRERTLARVAGLMKARGS